MVIMVIIDNVVDQIHVPLMTMVMSIVQMELFELELWRCSYCIRELLSVWIFIIISLRNSGLGNCQALGPSPGPSQISNLKLKKDQGPGIPRSRGP